MYLNAIIKACTYTEHHSLPLLFSPRVPWNTDEFEIATVMLPATENQIESVF